MMEPLDYALLHAHHETPEGGARTTSARSEEQMSDEEIVEVRCPECGASVRVPKAKAEREYKAKCPKGHEIPLVKAL
jgi:uncharacterized paraquat-inducible protein A